jgi:hypothetical protein
VALQGIALALHSVLRLTGVEADAPAPADAGERGL